MKTIYERAIEKFGWDKQVDMLIEEMAELTQALLKHRRGKEGALENVHEEIADVEIVLSQIKTKLNHGLINEFKEAKLERMSVLVGPDKKWQYHSKHDLTWKDCSDEEYEQMQHLARFEFRQVEV